MSRQALVAAYIARGLDAADPDRWEQINRLLALELGDFRLWLEVSVETRLVVALLDRHGARQRTVRQEIVELVLTHDAQLTLVALALKQNIDALSEAAANDDRWPKIRSVPPPTHIATKISRLCALEGALKGE